jgi:hypothetical protein
VRKWADESDAVLPAPVPGAVAAGEASVPDRWEPVTSRLRAYGPPIAKVVGATALGYGLGHVLGAGATYGAELLPGVPTMVAGVHPDTLRTGLRVLGAGAAMGSALFSAARGHLANDYITESAAGQGHVPVPGGVARSGGMLP